MSDLVNIADLDKEIEKILKENFREVSSKVVAAANYVANETRDKLKQTSPKDSGRYSEGWTVKKADTWKDSIFRSYEAVVHNKDRWFLTHLLELGHAIKGGTQRVKAYPHIREAEEEAAEAYRKELQKRLL